MYLFMHVRVCIFYLFIQIYVMQLSRDFDYIALNGGVVISKAGGMK
jgi:hypothetical protein